MFERFKFKKDRVRTEDEAGAEELERLLWSGYTMLGYEIIRVPVMPVQERTDYILSNI